MADTELETSVKTKNSSQIEEDQQQQQRQQKQEIVTDTLSDMIIVAAVLK